MAKGWNAIKIKPNTGKAMAVLVALFFVIAALKQFKVIDFSAWYIALFTVAGAILVMIEVGGTMAVTDKNKNLIKIGGFVVALLAIVLLIFEGFDVLIPVVTGMKPWVSVLLTGYAVYEILT